MTWPRDRLRVAVVSSFAETGDTYPQVAAVARILRERFDVTWALIGERGLFLDELVAQRLLTGKARDRAATLAALGRDWRVARSAVRGADLVVAIDFMAFACVSSAARCPVVLWSLDYVSDDEVRYGRKINRLWLSWLRRSLRRNPNLLIQDDARGASFVRAMRLPDVAFTQYALPVALPDAGEPPAARDWRGRPHVMQIGGINASRSCSDFLIARWAARPDAFDLTVHGRIYDDVRGALAAAGGRVTVSSGMLEPAQVPALVSTCSVGFIGNRQGHEQFRLLKKANGQLVEYLRCGKPVISMGPNDLGPYLEEKGVGFCVADAAGFDAALAAIHADYAAYSQRAYDLFKAEYDLAAYEPGLCAFLTEIMRTGRRRAASREGSHVRHAPPLAIGEPR